MIINRIDKATRVLGAPPGQEDTVQGLPVREVMSSIGRAMVSSWEPSADELRRLNAGEPVQLWIYGFSHPVVSLSVGVDLDDYAPA